MLKNHQITDQSFKESYNHYDIALNKKRLIVTIPLATLFIILFSLLDMVVYPDIAKILIKTRMGADIVLIFLLIFVIFNKNWTQRKIKAAGFLLVFFITIQINILIFLSEGMSSPYYAGLALTMLAISALLPWDPLETVVACVLMLAIFLSTVFFHSSINGLQYNIPILVNSIFFLFSTSVFCSVANYFNAKLRFTEFSLNYNLKSTNIKLISTQAQLIQSEKISAMGHLSAGILHEINNPLNYTIAAVRIVKMDDKIIGDEDLKDTVADIEEGMNRIKNIVSDLHNFSHPEEAGKYNQFAIADAIESSVRFTADECKDIEKIIDVPKDLMVSGAKTHIVQILINLITNACKAIAKAGNAKAKNGGIIKIWTEQKNNRVIIFVSDNGIGMNEETLAKVFDPFFTTSEVGKGMGMGLSVSYTIAKNHGGTLSATSKLGDGSVFSFDLSMTNS